jgi:ribosomal protein S18 acetylase RimI-like enzyme
VNVTAPHAVALLSQVEDAGLNASAPPQQRWLDGWLVRFSPGKAKRSRCVNAVAPGRLALEQRLAEARTVYSGAGLPLIVRITPFSVPDDLDRRLEGLGLVAMDDTRVMVAPSLADVPSHPLPAGAVLRALNSDAFAERVGILRESSAAQRRAHALRLASSPVPYQGVALEQDGDIVACGQCVREGRFVGLYDVFTAPHCRGRGLAGGLCCALLDRARREGAEVGYLQVEADNIPARRAYHRLGFSDGYAYHYRIEGSAPK